MKSYLSILTVLSFGSILFIFSVDNELKLIHSTTESNKNILSTGNNPIYQQSDPVKNKELVGQIVLTTVDEKKLNDQHDDDTTNERKDIEKDRQEKKKNDDEESKDQSNSNEERVSVVDNIFYDGEHVLLLRLAALYDKVDRFYIVELNVTMDGEKKDTLHKDNNAHVFEPFMDKIFWIVAGKEQVQTDKDIYYDDKRRDLRMVIKPFLEDDMEVGIISEPFIIINCDVDEIMNPNDIDEFQPRGKYHDLVTTQSPVMLQMESFEYNMNWRTKDKVITGQVLPGRLIENTNLFHLPRGGGSAVARELTFTIDSGYRLSNFFDVNGLSNKLKYTPENEPFSSLTYLRRDECAQKCASGEEVNCTWKRCNQNNIEHWDYKQAPVMLQKFHEVVCKMQNVDPSTGNVLSASSPTVTAFSSDVVSEFRRAQIDDWTSTGVTEVPHNGEKVTVVDAFQYCGEEVVIARLATLYDIVDRFYICEGTHFFSGGEKDKLFKDINEHLFEPYKKKIQWVVHNMSEVNVDDNWGREMAGRRAPQAVIREDFDKGEIKHPFVVINSDVDEIPEPRDIRDFQPGRKYHAAAISSIMVFHMKFFYYNLNWKLEEPWRRAQTIPGHLALSEFGDFQFLREDRIVNWVAAKVPGGYHMSFFMDMKGIRKKLETFSHQEHNKDELKSEDHIIHCITTGADIIKRRNVIYNHWDYKQAPLPLQQLHESVCKKQGVDPLNGTLLSSTDIVNEK